MVVVGLQLMAFTFCLLLWQEKPKMRCICGRVHEGFKTVHCPCGLTLRCH
jgi:hypothetical protein